MIARRNVLVTVWLGLWMISGVSEARPNIIVVMADDLDLSTLDWALSHEDLDTNAALLPNIQKYLVDRGVRFKESFTTNSLCCPSRATFLTGQYSHNHGMLQVNRTSTKKGITYWLDENGGSKLDRNTLAVWLQDAGYRTGLIGKYLNGYGVDTQKILLSPAIYRNNKLVSPAVYQHYIPPGWEDWHGLLDSETLLLNTVTNEKRSYSTYSVRDYAFYDNDKVAYYYNTDVNSDPDAGYQTYQIASRAKDFIGKNDGRPYFLWLTPLAPHIEKNYENPSAGAADSVFRDSIRPPKKYESLRFAERALSSSRLESDLYEKCSIVPNLLSLTKNAIFSQCARLWSSYVIDPIKIDPLIRQQFIDRLHALKSIDDLVGSVGELLDVDPETNTYKNTVFVFTSDNGWFYGEHRLSGKQWPYEESIRVPLVVASPFHGGAVESEKLVLNNDLAPTIAEVAGATPRRAIDGRSLVPLLADPGSPTWTRLRFAVENFVGGAGRPTTSPPTFLAIREKFAKREIGSFTELRYDNLYIRYVDSLESLGGVPVWREYYDLTSDPTEERGWDLYLRSNAVLVQSRDSLVRSLSTCSGAGCRDLESLPSSR